MKKKSLIYLIVAIVLVLVSLFVILYESGVIGKKHTPLSDIFAIKDTTKVTKVFLADMHGNTVLLSRTDEGWIVNDSLRPTIEKVESLLSVLMNLKVREVVPKAMQSSINSMLSVGAVKVEIYEKAPKFSLFGIKFFNKERNTKTYYMGSATQDNLANFASLVGFDEPYVVYVPGFRGFVTPQFSTFEEDWLSHRVFETKITRIEKLESIDYINPEESFTVLKVGPRFFDLYNGQNQKVLDYDTTKLIDMLSEYRNKNFETIDHNLTSAEKDSILQYDLFKKITLTDIEGQKTEMKFYWMRNIENEMEDPLSETEEHDLYSRDRFYAVVNGDESRIMKMQFFHFDRQVQPLSYFLEKGYVY